MTGARFLGWLLAVVTLITTASPIAQAKGLRDLLEGEETITTANEKLLAELSAYYREYAKVRLGRESRLANGAAWRLLTDVRTGLSVPRLTWMPDRDRLKVANALFDAVHGELLVRYEQQDIEYRTRMLYDREDGERPYFVIGPPFRNQVKVAVTYASSRLVSYVETGMEHRNISFGLEVRGLVLDLDRGRISTIESCKERENGFRFGELLDVCDDEALERFIAIWVNKVDTVVKKARDRGDELSVQCAESMRPLDGENRINPSWIQLYLTPSGVAVFNRYWNPNSAKFCAFDDITVNPIVIPYRDLEPFMKPGPWRDELLGQSR